MTMFHPLTWPHTWDGHETRDMSTRRMQLAPMEKQDQQLDQTAAHV